MSWICVFHNRCDALRTSWISRQATLIMTAIMNIWLPKRCFIAYCALIPRGKFNFSNKKIDSYFLKTLLGAHSFLCELSAIDFQRWSPTFTTSHVPYITFTAKLGVIHHENTRWHMKCLTKLVINPTMSYNNGVVIVVICNICSTAVDGGAKWQ